MALGDNLSMYQDLPTSGLTTGTTGLGGYFDAPPTVTQTFAGSPAALWQAARMGQMTNQRAALPQFQRAAMAGYQPAFGGFLLGGGGGTFADYLGGARASDWVDPTSQNWTSALAASDALRNPGTTRAPLTPEQLVQQGYMAGPNARTNALAMAAAAMGGGAGYGAQARQRAVGNLYDLYSARAAGAGEDPGGFLSWFGDRYQVPAVAT